MKIHAQILILKYLVYLFAAEVSAQSNTSPSAGDLLAEKWEQGNFASISSHVASLEASAPNDVITLLSSSFKNTYIDGRLKDGYAKLQRILQDAKVRPASYSAGFIDQLDALAREIAFEIEAHKRKGTSDSELEASASPTLLRQVMGSNQPAFIPLIKLAPNGVTLP